MTVNRQMNEQVTIYKPAGDQGILIQFGNQINTETNRTIRVFAALIERENREGIGEVIIGFSTLLVHYNPSLLSFQDAVAWLKRLEQRVQNIEPGRVRCVKIPVLYGGQWGPDLANVAKMNGLTEEEVVRIHSRPNYLVFFLGFTPGFPFLGGMSDKIATPRLATPRLSIPRGSVGIANHQTGIYPLESPGGWQLIGRTPVALVSRRSGTSFSTCAGRLCPFCSD